MKGRSTTRTKAPPTEGPGETSPYAADVVERVQKRRNAILFEGSGAGRPEAFHVPEKSAVKVGDLSPQNDAERLLVGYGEAVAFERTTVHWRAVDNPYCASLSGRVSAIATDVATPPPAMNDSDVVSFWDDLADYIYIGNAAASGVADSKLLRKADGVGDSRPSDFTVGGMSYSGAVLDAALAWRNQRRVAKTGALAARYGKIVWVADGRGGLERLQSWEVVKLVRLILNEDGILPVGAHRNNRSTPVTIQLGKVAVRSGAPERTVYLAYRGPPVPIPSRPVVVEYDYPVRPDGAVSTMANLMPPTSKSNEGYSRLRLAPDASVGIVTTVVGPFSASENAHVELASSGRGKCIRYLGLMASLSTKSRLLVQTVQCAVGCTFDLVAKVLGDAGPSRPRPIGRRSFCDGGPGVFAGVGSLPRPDPASTPEWEERVYRSARGGAPVTGADCAKVSGAEALVRWSLDSLGEIREVLLRGKAGDPRGSEFDFDFEAHWGLHETVAPPPSLFRSSSEASPAAPLAIASGTGLASFVEGDVLAEVLPPMGAMIYAHPSVALGSQVTAGAVEEEEASKAAKYVLYHPLLEIRLEGQSIGPLPAKGAARVERPSGAFAFGTIPIPRADVLRNVVKSDGRDDLAEVVGAAVGMRWFLSQRVTETLKKECVDALLAYGDRKEAIERQKARGTFSLYPLGGGGAAEAVDYSASAYDTDTRLVRFCFARDVFAAWYRAVGAWTADARGPLGSGSATGRKEKDRLACLVGLAAWHAVARSYLDLLEVPAVVSPGGPRQPFVWKTFSDRWFSVGGKTSEVDARALVDLLLGSAIHHFGVALAVLAQNRAVRMRPDDFRATVRRIFENPAMEGPREGGGLERWMCSLDGLRRCGEIDLAGALSAMGSRGAEERYGRDRLKAYRAPLSRRPPSPPLFPSNGGVLLTKQRARPATDAAGGPATGLAYVIGVPKPDAGTGSGSEAGRWFPFSVQIQSPTVPVYGRVGDLPGVAGTSPPRGRTVPTGATASLSFASPNEFAFLCGEGWPDAVGSVSYELLSGFSAVHRGKPYPAPGSRFTVSGLSGLGFYRDALRGLASRHGMLPPDAEGVHVRTTLQITYLERVVRDALERLSEPRTVNPWDDAWCRGPFREEVAARKRRERVVANDFAIPDESREPDAGALDYVLEWHLGEEYLGETSFVSRDDLHCRLYNGTPGKNGRNEGEDEAPVRGCGRYCLWLVLDSAHSAYAECTTADASWNAKAAIRTSATEYAGLRAAFDRWTEALRRSDAAAAGVATMAASGHMAAYNAAVATLTTSLEKRAGELGDPGVASNVARSSLYEMVVGNGRLHGDPAEDGPFANTMDCSSLPRFLILRVCSLDVLGPDDDPPPERDGRIRSAPPRSAPSWISPPGQDVREFFDAADATWGGGRRRPDWIEVSDHGERVAGPFGDGGPAVGVPSPRTVRREGVPFAVSALKYCRATGRYAIPSPWLDDLCAKTLSKGRLRDLPTARSSRFMAGSYLVRYGEQIVDAATSRAVARAYARRVKVVDPKHTAHLEAVEHTRDWLFDFLLLRRMRVAYFGPFTPSMGGSSSNVEYPLIRYLGPLRDLLPAVLLNCREGVLRRRPLQGVLPRTAVEQGHLGLADAEAEALREVVDGTMRHRREWRFPRGGGNPHNLRDAGRRVNAGQVHHAGFLCKLVAEGYAAKTSLKEIAAEIRTADRVVFPASVVSTEGGRDVAPRTEDGGGTGESEGGDGDPTVRVGSLLNALCFTYFTCSLDLGHAAKHADVSSRLFGSSDVTLSNFLLVDNESAGRLVYPLRYALVVRCFDPWLARTFLHDVRSNLRRADPLSGVGFGPSRPEGARRFGSPLGSRGAPRGAEVGGSGPPTVDAFSEPSGLRAYLSVPGLAVARGVARCLAENVAGRAVRHFSLSVATRGETRSAKTVGSRAVPLLAAIAFAIADCSNARDAYRADFVARMRANPDLYRRGEYKATFRTSGGTTTWKERFHVPGLDAYRRKKGTLRSRDVTPTIDLIKASIVEELKLKSKELARALDDDPTQERAAEFLDVEGVDWADLFVAYAQFDAWEGSVSAATAAGGRDLDLGGVVDEGLLGPLDLVPKAEFVLDVLENCLGVLEETLRWTADALARRGPPKGPEPVPELADGVGIGISWSWLCDRLFPEGPGGSTARWEDLGPSLGGPPPEALASLRKERNGSVEGVRRPPAATENLFRNLEADGSSSSPRGAAVLYLSRDGNSVSGSFDVKYAAERELPDAFSVLWRDGSSLYGVDVGQSLPAPPTRFFVLGTSGALASAIQGIGVRFDGEFMSKRRFVRAFSGMLRTVEPTEAELKASRLAERTSDALGIAHWEWCHAANPRFGPYRNFANASLSDWVKTVYLPTLLERSILDKIHIDGRKTDPVCEMLLREVEETMVEMWNDRCSIYTTEIAQ
jgi:hypothetical protein